MRIPAILIHIIPGPATQDGLYSRPKGMTAYMEGHILRISPETASVPRHLSCPRDNHRFTTISLNHIMLLNSEKASCRSIRMMSGKPWKRTRIPLEVLNFHLANCIIRKMRINSRKLRLCALLFFRTS